MLGPDGRFLEMGARELREDPRYHRFDLLRAGPDRIRGTLADLLDLLHLLDLFGLRDVGGAAGRAVPEGDQGRAIDELDADGLVRLARSG
jgi:hypothetical protein